MIRGTTPTHLFHTNIDLTNAKIYVTYKQNGVTIIEKSNDDISIESDSIKVSLEQKDTLRFKAGLPVQMQIRYVKQNGSAGASNYMSTEVTDILKNGEIRA